MSALQWLGALLVAVFAASMFGFTTWAAGWRVSLAIWTFVVVGVAALFLGLALLTGKLS